VTAQLRGARAATLLLVVFAALVSSTIVPGNACAQAPNWVPRDSASFEIYQGDVLLGTEEYRAFQTSDTLIMGSTLRLPGAAKDSKLPLEKRTTFLRRMLDSYPLVFQVIDYPRDAEKGHATAINCMFHDTSAVIYREITGQVGRGESIALPPGRLYILEPGIYAQVQTLAADFLVRKQERRKQPVLIPSAQSVVEITMTRGPVEKLGQGDVVVTTQRVIMTDGLTQLVAWIDPEGRMMKMEAPREGLRVERVLPAKPAKPTTAGSGKSKKKG